MLKGALRAVAGVRKELEAVRGWCVLVFLSRLIEVRTW